MKKNKETEIQPYYTPLSQFRQAFMNKLRENFTNIEEHISNTLGQNVGCSSQKA